MRSAPLAVTDIVGHLAVTPGEVTAWFLLDPQQWAFRSDAQRMSLLLAHAQRVVGLAGHSLHTRVTSRPYPVRVWAEGLDHLTPAPLPGVPGRSWGDFLVGSQEHLASSTLADKEVYLGVRLTGRSAMAGMMDRVTRGPRRSERSRLDAEAARIAEIVAAPGLDGHPCTPAQMEWLLRRSVGVGLPAPTVLGPNAGDWTGEDLQALSDVVDYEVAPLGRTVKVTGWYEQRSVVRHVAVLTLGRVEEWATPENGKEPWMALADRLPFPVEWSCRIDVLSGEQAAPTVGRKLLVIRDQQKHYRDHGLDSPLDLARKADRARAVEDEMAEGQDLEATRAYGWVRLAVSGRSEEETLARVRQVTDLYRTQARMALEHPKGQYALLREFTPGQPLACTAYRRRLTALYLAAALPAVSSQVGDRRGPLLGPTAGGGGRRAVMFDTHFATEVREASGLVPVTGGLGAGKALALDTPLPTPTGWTTMGQVAVGDHLLGSDGEPVSVVAATQVMHGRPCYEVLFSDGERIVADAEHQWMTYTHRARVSAIRNPEQSKRQVLPSAVTTREIAATLMTAGQRPQVNHAVRVSAPLALPEADLPVPPYVLGAWLGDGTSRSAMLTLADDDAAEIIVAVEGSGVPAVRREHSGDGLHAWRLGRSRDVSRPPGPDRTGGRRNHVSTQTLLRRLGVLGNKHIPAVYLRASEEQRRALLAGLLDTDGYCNPTSGTVEFAVTDERLARDARELVVSLGYKATLRTKPCPGGRAGRQTAYTVAFTPSDKVFLLSRKASRQNPGVGRGSSARRMHDSTRHMRYIVAVQPVPSVPVRCVQVANDEHLYLAGRSMIPTHNSVLLGSICYQAVVRGIRTTILDPSGPLGRLAGLPEFAGRARHIDLLSADPGMLNPYTVVAQPRREQFGSDDEFTAAEGAAGRDRRALTLDVLRMFLPPQVDALPDSRLVLQEAIHANGGSASASPWGVVEALERSDNPHGKVLARYLRDVSEMPQARLIFPAGGRAHTNYDETLLVLTMPGMVLPDLTAPRESWSSEEAMSVPMLHLASYYASRRIYSRQRDERKVIALDETHFLAGWASGRALFNRLARDSRKWNACVLAASQNPGDVLGNNVANFLSTVFVGRTEDPDVARDALRMLRVPAGVGYEQVLAGLSPQDRRSTVRSGTREFVMRDVDGNVERIRIDLGHLPGLLEALDTTADPTRLQPSLQKVPA